MVSRSKNPQKNEAGSATPRPAQEVIDSAIRENRGWEYICYGLVVTFAAMGATLIGIGAFRGDGIVAMSGSIASLFLWPSLKYAIAIRRENMAIRLLELAIGQAKTAEEAAKAIKDAFVTQFRGKDKNDVVSKT